MESTTPTSIGERLNYLRTQDLKMTQRELADQLGIGHTYISKVEKGKEVPSRVLTKLISVEFGVSENWLLTGKEPMYEPLEADLLDPLLSAGPEAVIKAALEIVGDDPNVAAAGAALARIKGTTQEEREFAHWLRVLLETWGKGDPSMRGWLIVQMRRSFGDLQEDGSLNRVPPKDGDQ